MLRVTAGRFPEGIANELPLAMVNFATNTHRIASNKPKFTLVFNQERTRWVAHFEKRVMYGNPDTGEVSPSTEQASLVGFVRKEDGRLRLDCVDDPTFWMQIEK